MQEGEAEGEEAGVGRQDGGLQAVLETAGLEEEKGEGLGLEPGHGFGAQPGEGIAIEVLETRLVGGAVVGDGHAVGIAPAHVGVEVVGGDSVADPADFDFGDEAAPGHFIGHGVDAMEGLAGAEFHQFLDRAGQRPTGTGAQDLGQFGRQLGSHRFAESGLFRGAIQIFHGAS